MTKIMPSFAYRIVGEQLCRRRAALGECSGHVIQHLPCALRWRDAVASLLSLEAESHHSGIGEAASSWSARPRIHQMSLTASARSLRAVAEGGFDICRESFVGTALVVSFSPCVSLAESAGAISKVVTLHTVARTHLHFTSDLDFIPALFYLSRVMTMPPNKSPEPTAVGACQFREDFASFYVAVRRWLSFFR